jgi:hypothetical protein
VQPWVHEIGVITPPSVHPFDAPTTRPGSNYMIVLEFHDHA